MPALLAIAFALPATTLAFEAAPREDAAPRGTVACPPVALHVIVAHAEDDALIGRLLWEAGVPAGSSASFHHGAGADERAHAAASLHGRVVVAPDVPTLAWAQDLLAC